jgi:hypothetical protein
MAKSIGSGFSPFGVDESDSRVSTEVRDCEPVFAITKIRLGAMWRAPPPFADLRTAACANWHAALMRRASWFYYFPAMRVQELRIWQSGHASIEASPYLRASLPL